MDMSVLLYIPTLHTCRYPPTLYNPPTRQHDSAANPTSLINNSIIVRNYSLAHLLFFQISRYAN